MSHPPRKRDWASSFETAGRLITLSPCCQSAGVATQAGCQLQRIDDPQLGKLRPVDIGYVSCSPIRLSGSAHEHRTHGLIVRSGAPVTAVTGRRRQHVIELREREFGVGDDRVGRTVSGHILDIAEPARGRRPDRPGRSLSPRGGQTRPPARQERQVRLCRQGKSFGCENSTPQSLPSQS